jgi:hypothetical protein
VELSVKDYWVSVGDEQRTEIAGYASPYIYTCTHYCTSLINSRCLQAPLFRGHHVYMITVCSDKYYTSTFALPLLHHSHPKTWLCPPRIGPRTWQHGVPGSNQVTSFHHGQTLVVLALRASSCRSLTAFHGNHPCLIHNSPADTHDIITNAKVCVG